MNILEIPEREAQTSNLNAPATQQAQPLRECVERAMENYFLNLGGHTPAELYDMVLAEVEAPLLEAVMKYTKDNQSRAAIVLGLSRGTLRKKLKQYGLLEASPVRTEESDA